MGKHGAGMLLANMDESGEISVYHVEGGGLAFSFGPEDEEDEDQDFMLHQGFAVGDAGMYLASARGSNVMLWQLSDNGTSSTIPALKGTFTAHLETVVQVGSFCTHQ
jgi:hypothetical protein